MNRNEMKTAIYDKLKACEDELLAEYPNLTVPRWEDNDYDVTFDVRGRCAGKAARDGTQVKFNMTLALENGDEFIDRTVPHEFAHIVTSLTYGIDVQPHGRHWKSIMVALGVEPSRCHSFDTSNVTTRKVARCHTYGCGCETKVHNLTSIRHNRVVRGEQVYFCRRCKFQLFQLAKV